jgi:hypothetical protein
MAIASVHHNTMATCTTGAIALRPTGNEQGGYYFLSLTTGRQLNRNRWTALPMPADVINRVHTLVRRSNASRELTFADRSGDPFLDHDGDDSTDESYDPDNGPDHEDDDSTSDNDDDDDNYADIPNAADAIDIPIEGVNRQELNENISNNEDANNQEDGNDDATNEEDGNDEATNEEYGNEAATKEEDGNAADYITEENGDEAATNEDDGNEADYADQANTEDTMIEKYGERSGAHNLRTRRPRDYSHLHTTLESTMMTQYSMKKGIKVFGPLGVDAVLKELKQLHDRTVIAPKDAAKLSREDKQASLQCLVFLKKKRPGVIKARGCADGRKQRPYNAKEDASSPTVAIESVMLSCLIDAKEHRDVATVGIPGTFMHADMEDLVHMKLEGKMVELLVKLDPKLYQKYVQMHNGKQVLYVELKKALYGTLKAALLFWKKLSAQLKEWGFEIYPYDWCVANKMMNGKQCTILWHVDDLKISHVNPNAVTEVIQLLEEEFGKEAPLTKMRGKVHDYLGMTLDFSSPGQAKILMIDYRKHTGMIDYIKYMLEEMPSDMDGEAPTPASNHLFQVNEKDPVMLDDDTATMFHHNVAKLLFLSKLQSHSCAQG